MYILKTENSFDSAHFLHGYCGKCANIHGHRWRVIVEVKSEQLDSNGQTRGMIVDFGKLKEDLQAVTDIFDHTLIYEADTLKETTIKALNEEGFKLTAVSFRPTAENFAKYFFDKLVDIGYQAYMVKVYETPNNCACYTE